MYSDFISTPTLGADDKAVRVIYIAYRYPFTFLPLSRTSGDPIGSLMQSKHNSFILCRPNYLLSLSSYRQTLCLKQRIAIATLKVTKLYPPLRTNSIIIRDLSYQLLPGISSMRTSVSFKAAWPRYASGQPRYYYIN